MPEAVSQLPEGEVRPASVLARSTHPRVLKLSAGQGHERQTAADQSKSSVERGANDCFSENRPVALDAVGLVCGSRSVTVGRDDRLVDLVTFTANCFIDGFLFMPWCQKDFWEQRSAVEHQTVVLLPTLAHWRPSHVHVKEQVVSYQAKVGSHL